ncbi:hypothetical protein GRF29_185g981583 [Pseudopithomyces chartarum]|uniref:Uncharacterized protein n=1 Tax=Pseudopithomyces chartarum TaxID=1892770 RepID=A0AAN6RBZ5_9PLEO|nr:hypothetical protein GRF29_185g981583 [Pseudopithomyces chartarum]
MKLSIGFISILLTSALALSVKRQNDIPGCEEGDASDVSGPFQTGSECEDVCYMTEQAGDRVGQICKGYCSGTPLVTGDVVYNCFVKE